MAKINFETTKLVVADPGGQIRDEIRGVLHHEGFRDIVLAENVKTVEELVAKGNVDLLIAEHEFPRGNMIDLVRRIRHHELGDNPFIVIILMAHDPEKEDILRIIDTGADDLILKPITAGALVKRVNFLVSQRKDFVVTADYIGPTRRSGNREGELVIPEMEVPNPVQRKALGQSTGTGFQKEIDKFADIVNVQKVERNAFQITFLVETIIPLYVDGKAVTDTKKQLDRLKYVSEDIGRRMKGTKYDDVSELCVSILGVVNSICKKPNRPDSTDLKLLPKLAQAIEVAFSTGTGGTDIALSISDSVKRRDT
ncbi:MAG: response regulator [Rhodospirillaceae bacterium]|jgi:DNA-binding response OmpR family regulator|nr:response regulator [Rhodospirillaceae bacterium]